MEIIIGRNQSTRQLTIIKDGIEQHYGQPNSVPMDVSRHHISLHAVGNGKWIIKNLNEQNVTFVNGLAIENKTISEIDTIELGNSHYLLPWNSILAPKEDTVDITPLKKIWIEYEDLKIENQIAERKFNVARSATGIITTIALVCSIILGHGPIYITLYVLAIAISVAFTYQAYQKSTAVPRQQQELNKDFQRRYVCPKCGHFMGYQDYEILMQNDVCPYCKTKYQK